MGLEDFAAGGKSYKVRQASISWVDINRIGHCLCYYCGVGGDCVGRDGASKGEGKAGGAHQQPDPDWARLLDVSGGLGRNGASKRGAGGV